MQFSEQIVQNRTILSVISLCTLAALIPGVTQLNFDASYTAYFDPSDPHIPVYDDINQRYELNDNVVIVLQNLQGSMLDSASWELLSDLTTRLAELPFVIRSQSASNFIDSHIEGPESSNSLGNRPAQALLSNMTAPRNLSFDALDGLFISKYRNYALINLVYALPENQKPTELLETFKHLRANVDAAISQSTLKVTAHYTGTLALNEAYIKVVKHDLRAFFPGLLIAFFVSLYLFYRSLRIAAVIMLVALFAAVGAFGLAGWLGIPLASIHSFVPVIIATISIAGSVHLVTSFYDTAGTDNNLKSHLIEVVSLNLVPITLTCVTTAIGFLALMFSPSPPVQRVGYIVAVGVLIAWMLNLSLLLRLLPAPSPGEPARKRLSINMQPFIQLSARHGIPVILLFTGLGVVAVVGVSKSTINDNVFAYFDESLQFSQDTALVEQYFSGVQELAFEISTPLDNTVLDIDYLQNLRSVNAWFTSHPSVRRVVTLDDFLPKPDRDVTSMPSDSSNVDQWWADNVSGTADQYVTSDLHASRLLVYTNNLDATQFIDFETLAREKIFTVFSPELVKGGTGTSLLFALLGKRNARSMVLSLSTALVCISLLIGLIAKSGRVVWVSLICNILPVALVYAIWTLSGGYISLGGAIVMGMILGIVVDDTIFLLSRYVLLQKSGNTVPVQEALAQVGPALLITSTTLCVGLGIGMLSNFLPIFTMSLLSVFIIALALLGDIVLLPALLMLNLKNNATLTNFYRPKEK